MQQYRILLILKQANRNRGVRSTRRKTNSYFIRYHQWRTILESFLRDFHPSKVHCRLDSVVEREKTGLEKFSPGFARIKLVYKNRKKAVLYTTDLTHDPISQL